MVVVAGIVDARLKLEGLAGVVWSCFLAEASLVACNIISHQILFCSYIVKQLLCVSSLKIP